MKLLKTIEGFKNKLELVTAEYNRYKHSAFDAFVVTSGTDDFSVYVGMVFENGVSTGEFENTFDILKAKTYKKVDAVEIANAIKNGHGDKGGILHYKAALVRNIKNIKSAIEFNENLIDENS